MAVACGRSLSRESTSAKDCEKFRIFQVTGIAGRLVGKMVSGLFVAVS
jgi:hypothetical protein